jgi:hypothetical protein
MINELSCNFLFRLIYSYFFFFFGDTDGIRSGGFWSRGIAGVLGVAHIIRNGGGGSAICYEAF